jgi:phosphoglycerate dehydrogenase-like enzyme
MNFVIAPPIKETYEKDIRTLFPDAALFWLEELDEEKRKKALEKADVVLSRNIVGDIRKEEIPLLAKPAMVQTTRTGVDHLDFKKLPKDIRLYCNSGG